MRQRLSERKRLVMVMFLSTIIVLGMVLLIRHLELEGLWLRLLETVQSAGLWGQSLFMLVVVLTVIGLVPTVLLTLGAGMLYGLVQGSAMIVIGETIGAVVAFWLGRTLLSGYISSLFAQRSRVLILLSLPGRHDWRLVALIRMLPFFPFKLSNYFFGLTPLSATSYIAGTFLGLWPITVFNVYLGSIASDLIALKTVSASDSPFQWLIYIFGLVCTGGVILLITRRAKRELEQRTTSHCE